MANLDTTVRELAERAAAGRSPVRARQVRWVAGELLMWLTRHPTNTAPATVHALLSPDPVRSYLADADAGLLRTRGVAGTPSAPATCRVRRDCLTLLAQAAGLGLRCEHLPMPVLHDGAEAVPSAIALSHWTARATSARAVPGHVRAAAISVLVAEHGLRSGELAALLISDLDLAAQTLTYTPMPPAARRGRSRRTVTLSASSAAVLARWVQIRSTLVADRPRTHTLWVSLRANHDGYGVRRPAGLPVRPGGIRRAHRAAVLQVNEDLAAAPGYSPLPRTPARLRNATAATLRAPY